MIEWVNSRQKTPLKKVVAWVACPAENKIIYLVRDCDCLDIWHGQWVTIDNLLTMDGIDIILKSSTLTSSDVNVFLKHWLSGGCPRLKLFRARIDSVDILQVLDGLMHNAVFVEDRRNYTSPFGYNRTLSFGYDTKRADGVTATVCEQGNGTLAIAVWPETTYNYN
ncbi:hypothetical protein GCK72_015416 [Caenorhabditis remanei]|uniref:Sdz-33 F-box domain-containing protein n=1 Tax=Caenorhabditis remanei TaxID=31234 RepID=A0A6A5GWG3_CAERE|nr:hypothetical protein GCK72_015416 [Caenorhabditis remanei]KAF1758956.1 hypothetical protein GCK72_015416 [Caenorhabditis remanei]